MRIEREREDGESEQRERERGGGRESFILLLVGSYTKLIDVKIKRTRDTKAGEKRYMCSKTTISIERRCDTV